MVRTVKGGRHKGNNGHGKGNENLVVTKSSLRKKVMQKGKETEEGQNGGRIVPFIKSFFG